MCRAVVVVVHLFLNDMTSNTFASIQLPPSTNRPNELRGIDPALDHVYAVFGDGAVLVPVTADAAANMAVACPAISIDQTRTVPHQARLTRENIAVAINKNGVHAIYFATAAALEDFLKSNPKLRESLVTAGPLGTVVWLICSEAETKTVSISGVMSWLGAGEAIVVSGRGPLEPLFTILNLAPPLEIKFGEINWPEPMRVEMILHSNAVLHGAPNTQDPRNRIIPNWGFWAESFSTINHVRYDVTRESFFQQRPGQLIQMLPPERVLCLISEFFSDFGLQKRFDLLLKFRQPRYLNEFLTVLKIVTARQPDPEDELEKFLAATVESCPGADVSSAELHKAQQLYFQTKKAPPYPLPVFMKRMPDHIERLFHGARSRKIQRDGKYCRGYRHVRIKRRRPETPGDGPT
jgi:hypothetical protein